MARPAKEPVSLSDLVTQVAAELRRLKEQKPKPGEEVINLTNCDIELSVEAVVEANAGIKFYIIELGGKGSAKAAHKITLKFGAVGNVVAAQSTGTPGDEQPKVRANPNR